MSRLTDLSLKAALAFALIVAYGVAAADELASNTPAAPAAPGLGDPGTLTAILVESGRNTAIVLRGRDAQQQLVVTGQFSSGQLRDFTRQVRYEANPPGVVSVDPTGRVLPLSDGHATLVAATAEGMRATTDVVVERFIDDTPVNFPNQVVPMFTKLGCNSGGCHGKASGQNGFKLSLLGFEPGEDYEHLVKEGRGRRLFPASPDRSLLLLKPINGMPHGGGQRMVRNWLEYKLMRRWIGQGMPY
ncbi:MAG: S-layer protein, partial [Pirellulales bacterium]